MSSGLRNVQAILPFSIGIVKPLAAPIHNFCDPTFTIRNSWKNIRFTFTEISHYCSRYRRVADAPIFIEYTVNRTPSFTDNHELPDIPSHFCIHVFLEGDIIRIRARNTSDFTVDQWLVHFCCKVLGPLDIISDLLPSLHVVVELEHIRVVCQFNHPVHKSHPDCDRSVMIEFVKSLCHELRIVKLPSDHFFGSCRPIGFIHNVPHCKSGLI